MSVAGLIPVDSTTDKAKAFSASISGQPARRINRLITSLLLDAFDAFADCS